MPINNQLHLKTLPPPPIVYPHKSTCRSPVVVFDMARRIHLVDSKNKETTSEIVTYQERTMKETPNASEDNLKMSQVSQVALEKNSFDSFESIDEEDGTVEQACPVLPKRILRQDVIQKIGGVVILFAFLVVAKRAFRPSQLQGFFTWMEEHPAKGIVTYTLISPLLMVFLVPAAPLVFGAGFIFKTMFGWVAGVILCSLVTLFGSLLGSIFCFILGRYWIRETVRRWSRKYPLFDAIDAGLMSYVIGTTSMPIKPFALARIAALPNTALSVYIGAATGTLFTHSSKGDGSERFEEVSLSPQVMILGIIVSIISLTLAGMKIKVELQKVLDEQKGKERDDGDNSYQHIQEDHSTTVALDRDTLTQNLVSSSKRNSTKFRAM